MLKRTGWLERFSNEPALEHHIGRCPSDRDAYVSAHGRSIRLEGLDARNCNAAQSLWPRTAPGSTVRR